jgi:membrane protease YdiL (CAAX protease family)
MLAMALASLLAYAGWVRVGERREADELALRPAPGELIAGLAIGGAMMSAVVLIMWAAGWAMITPVTPTRVWRALGMAIESGVVEEVAMRLIVFRLLWRAFGPWTALALSALLFGILHIVNPGSSLFAALCIAVEAGVMLAAFYILTGRLWVSIGVHAGWNFTQGWVFGAAVSGTDFFDGGPLDFEPMQAVPAFLSGGAFGPEASLAALVVGTGVGVATLLIARRRGRFVARDEVTFVAAAPQPAA